MTVVNLNAVVPLDHSLSAIKRHVDAVLQKLSRSDRNPMKKPKTTDGQRSAAGGPDCRTFGGLNLTFKLMLNPSNEKSPVVQ